MSEKDRPTDRPNASDCEQCAAIQRQNDLLANDRDGYVQVLTDENNKLRAENERLSAYAKRAAMDVLLCKDGNILVHEENERLRAALWDIHAICNNGPFVWAKRIRAIARVTLRGRQPND